jgi:hypothetical protein
VAPPNALRGQVPRERDVWVEGKNDGYNAPDPDPEPEEPNAAEDFLQVVDAGQNDVPAVLPQRAQSGPGRGRHDEYDDDSTDEGYEPLPPPAGFDQAMQPFQSAQPAQTEQAVQPAPKSSSWANWVSAAATIGMAAFPAAGPVATVAMGLMSAVAPIKSLLWDEDMPAELKGTGIEPYYKARDFFGTPAEREKKRQYFSYAGYSKRNEPASDEDDGY